jgi:hypothetical protein
MSKLEALRRSLHLGTTSQSRNEKETVNAQEWSSGSLRCLFCLPFVSCRSEAIVLSTSHLMGIDNRTW